MIGVGCGAQEGVLVKNAEALEVLEQALPLIGQYAGTGIGDLDPHHCDIRQGSQAQFDCASAGKLHRIVYQVEQHLPQPRRIGGYLPPRARCHGDAQGQILGLRYRTHKVKACRRDRLDSTLDQLQLFAPRFDCGQIEHTGDHLEQMLAGCQHGFHPRGLPLV